MVCVRFEHELLEEMVIFQLCGGSSSFFGIPLNNYFKVIKLLK